MSVLDHLRTLGRGDAPGDDGLLGNARCAWGRGELVGLESILAAFSARPLAPDHVLSIETPRGAALIGEHDAMIADVYDGRAGRLWRVGRGVQFPSEPAIDIAFDVDMRQERGDVFFRADDHPDLDDAAAERMLAAAKSHVDGGRRAGGLRVRAFVVRAFNSGQATAALLAVFAMSNGSVRSASFGYAIVGIGAEGDARVVSEQSPPREWSPRF